MTNTRFMLSPKFINNILDNCFGIPNENYPYTNIYVGLGIEFDAETFSFVKEPVSKFFTITEEAVEFSEPVNGIIRNKNAIEWNKATENWTNGDEKIKYIGLYYRLDAEESESNIIIKDDLDDDTIPNYNYELIGVLPLIPEETVLINERMVLNPNTIQIKLSNR